MAESRLKDIKILHREKLPVRDFFGHYGKDLQLALHTPEEDLDTNIAESGIHRPGLAMAGYTKVYSFKQIQVVGHTEWNYRDRRFIRADDGKQVVPFIHPGASKP